MASKIRAAVLERDAVSLEQALLNATLPKAKLSSSIQGKSPLALAVYLSFHEGVFLLLKHGVGGADEQMFCLDLREDRDRGTESLLGHAVRTGRGKADGGASVALAATLLRHGANPNAVDSSGLSPLCYSVLNNHASMVQVLLDNGALVHQSVPTTVIMPEAVGECGEFTTVLHISLCMGSGWLKVFYLLWHHVITHLWAQAPYEITDSFDNTILFTVVRLNRVDVLKKMLTSEEASDPLLLLRPPDRLRLLEAENANRLTPLKFALLRRHWGAASLLISLGCNTSSVACLVSPLQIDLSSLLAGERYQGFSPPPSPLCLLMRLFHATEDVEELDGICDLTLQVIDSGCDLRGERWVNGFWGEMTSRLEEAAGRSTPELLEAKRNFLETFASKTVAPLGLKELTRLRIRGILAGNPQNQVRDLNELVSQLDFLPALIRNFILYF